MTTTKEKIATVMGQKKPYLRSIDGKAYRLYDEFRSESRAQSAASAVRNAGYLARVIPRFIDDIRTGRSRTVYDVFVQRK
jgi:hypothetical protein